MSIMEKVMVIHSVPIRMTLHYFVFTGCDEQWAQPSDLHFLIKRQWSFLTTCFKQSESCRINCSFSLILDADFDNSLWISS
jgi:hypothetical protein